MMDINLPILAIWILLTSTTCRLISAINHPQTPLCLYPPPTSLQPPPAPPSPPYTKPDRGVWCVAKPTVTAGVMQQALDYACGAGAECEPIQVGGACYQPATMQAHASYAFNSYWQRNKRNGGTCDFGGSATLVSVDPSYNKCIFIFS